MQLVMQHCWRSVYLLYRIESEDIFITLLKCRPGYPVLQNCISCCGHVLFVFLTSADKALLVTGFVGSCDTAKVPVEVVPATVSFAASATSPLGNIPSANQTRLCSLGWATREEKKTNGIQHRTATLTLYGSITYKLNTHLLRMVYVSLKTLCL